MLKHLGFPQENPIKIYVDNRSAIALAKNPVYHKRSKHIDTRYHFIWEHVENKKVELISYKTNDQVAYIFTKPLKLKLMLGMTSLDTHEMLSNVSCIYNSCLVSTEDCSKVSYILWRNSLDVVNNLFSIIKT